MCLYTQESELVKEGQREGEKRKEEKERKEGR